MLYHSIVPFEIAFSQYFDTSNIKYFFGTYMNEKILFSYADDNKCKIEKIISSSLEPFLNNNLQPGTIVDLNQVKI
jgi:hypothetical protein